MKTINVYVTDEEKAAIQAAAEERHTTVSALMKVSAKKHLNLDNTDTQDEYDDILSGLTTEDELPNKQVKRDRLVRFYLSSEEYDHLKKRAGNHSISDYIRHTLLHSSDSKFQFIIKDDDLSDLERDVSDLISHVDGFITAMDGRTSVFAADIRHIEGLLVEIRDLMRDTNQRVHKNRISIKQQGRRYLEKQIRNILGTPEKKGSES